MPGRAGSSCRCLVSGTQRRTPPPNAWRRSNADPGSAARPTSSAFMVIAPVRHGSVRRANGRHTALSTASSPRRTGEAVVAYHAGMAFERITVNPERMGGKPCIRDLRVTVTMVLGQLAGGRKHRPPANARMLSWRPVEGGSAHRRNHVLLEAMTSTRRRYRHRMPLGHSACATVTRSPRS